MFLKIIINGRQTNWGLMYLVRVQYLKASKYGRERDEVVYSTLIFDKNILTAWYLVGKWVVG